jgi:hypothetical protein
VRGGRWRQPSEDWEVECLEAALVGQVGGRQQRRRVSLTYAAFNICFHVEKTAFF